MASLESAGNLAACAGFLRRFWRKIVRREFALGAANFDLQVNVGRKAGWVLEGTASVSGSAGGKVKCRRRDGWNGAGMQRPPPCR
jgi:hypothetical protein